jgi:hypothetical protein
MEGPPQARNKREVVDGIHGHGRRIAGILEFGERKGGNARVVAIQSWQSRLRLTVA